MEAEMITNEVLTSIIDRAHMQLYSLFPIAAYFTSDR